jgi:hypothetical protein
VGRYKGFLAVARHTQGALLLDAGRAAQAQKDWYCYVSQEKVCTRGILFVYLGQQLLLWLPSHEHIPQAIDAAGLHKRQNPYTRYKDLMSLQSILEVTEA